jgi:protein-S-isoprenylcysteine O-methyltransferase Ste14
MDLSRVALCFYDRYQYLASTLQSRITRGTDERRRQAWAEKLGQDISCTLLLPVFFGWYVLMALDAVRFRWSRMPQWLQLIGAGILLGAFYIFYLAFRENTYLSPAVRIQTDRGQTVVSTGLYRHVRHPLYAGFSFFLQWGLR